MKLFTIVGPTATGKTSLSINIARRVNGEIVSADSRQIYRHMEIGTAQPTAEQRRAAPFHLIGFIDPDHEYSCGQYARDAESVIDDIVARQRVPIVCGGTGLYIRALFDPLHPLPESDPHVKKRLVRELATRGIGELFRRLQECDPAWAERIGPTDTQRILRGLEVHELTGVSLSTLLNEKKRAPRYHACYIGLFLPRAELNRRIDERFDSMIAEGFVDEVRALVQEKYDPSGNALRTIGYREIIDHLSGKVSLSEAVHKAKVHTHQFAKRQLTWFRKLPDIQWYDARDLGLDAHLASYIRGKGNTEK